MKNPLINILVLNCNGKHLLKPCLESIFEQNFTDYELVVVDNNSNDGSTEYIKENFPNITLIENSKNLGFAGGNNMGIKACTGKWIFFLNNDAILEKNCLEFLAKHIENKKTEQLVFMPLMLKADSPELIDSAGDMLYPWGYAYKYDNVPANKPEFLESKEIALACCGAALFNRELIEKLNGFDEDFFLYYEDVDLSLRARHLGAEIWLVPQAKVFHKGSATVGKKTKSRLYYIERNRFFAKLKNFPLITLIKYAPISFACSTLSFILWTARGFLGAWIKSRIDMLKGISKMLKKRKKIFAESKISTGEFEKWLRKPFSPPINVKS
ncbi:glycosyl transferase [Fibrobacteria bacterium R8-3-H12]